MCHIRLDFLLALLEFSSADGDPLERPSPWSWPQWKEVLNFIGFPGSPPWCSASTFQQTGLQQFERENCKEFVVAYLAGGDNASTRRQFAMSLEEGPAYKGLILLGWWCGRFQKHLDGVVDRVLKDARMITGGPKTIVQIDKQNPHIVINTLADGLLGAEAYESPSQQAYQWLTYTFASFKARWRVVYDTRMRFIDQIPTLMYRACRDVSGRWCSASDIERYLQTLRDLLVELDFNLHPEREKQRDHYRQLLVAIRDSIDGGRLTATPPSVCIPPHMCNALALMESERIPAVRELLAYCDAYLEAGPEYVAEDYPDEFDAYAMLVPLRVSSLLPWDFPPHDQAAFVQLETGFDHVRSCAEVWLDDDKAGFMFTVTSLPRER